MFFKTFFLVLIGLSLAFAGGSHGHNHKDKGFHQQVHLSLGVDCSEMIVTWVTLESCPNSYVQYGLRPQMEHKSIAVSTEFNRNASFITHRALLSSLKCDTVYYYRVGSEPEDLSEIFTFQTMKSGNAWNPKLLIYGDLGYKNDFSLKYLIREFRSYDAIFHVGDFAYDLHDEFGEKGNKFMKEIQPVAAQIPYMTCPGNHEKHDNFSHYDARFSMLGDRHHPDVKKSLQKRLNNHYYSLDIGPAHIVVISTEFYYFYTRFGWESIAYQYEWLKDDLEKANKNRDKTPWIIVMGHRPFYTVKECSQPECDDKNIQRPAIREGIILNNQTQKHQFGLEKLFYDMGVDIHISGHEHLYARLFPVYNFTVKSGNHHNNPYQDPLAPITIITGSAGNKEEHPKDRPSGKSTSLPWVAHRHEDYGYTRMKFIDSHHILIEQTSDDHNGNVIDHFEIIKSTNKPKWIA